MHKSHKRSLEYFRSAIGQVQKGKNISRERALEVTFLEVLPTLEEIGKQVVEEAMRCAAGNITSAANLLGISRQGLSKRLKKHLMESSPE